MQEHRRIKFYSEHDMSFYLNLNRLEQFFRSWEQNTCEPDINTILELYNIRKYFHTDKIANIWADGRFREYKEKADQIPGIIGRFCNSASDADWLPLFKAVDAVYIDDFWGVINDYKIYKKNKLKHS